MRVKNQPFPSGMNSRHVPPVLPHAGTRLLSGEMRLQRLTRVRDIYSPGGLISLAAHKGGLQPGMINKSNQTIYILGSTPVTSPPGGYCVP